MERINYSVPFEYIRQKADVRLARAAVEAFCGGNRICSLSRLHGRFSQYSAIRAHIPPEHQEYVQQNDMQQKAPSRNHSQDGAFLLWIRANTSRRSRR
ncbi:MAG: Mu transposase domain-containing protein [Oscillospiraceae bacterium]